MQQLRRALDLLPTLASAGLLGGCAAAPSITVAGAYFPAWLVCLALALLGAIVARMVLAGAGLGQALALQLLVCLSSVGRLRGRGVAGWVVCERGGRQRRQGTRSRRPLR
jgi:hypothetical protein